MTIFIVIAEIGTKGWATTDCSCKALSGCSLCTGRASGGEGHNCRARRDQATGFAANILNREQKSGEEIANHPAKLQCVLKEWYLQWQRRFWKSKKPGGNKRTCFKGYFAVAFFAVDSVWFKDSDSSKAFSPFATTNVKCLPSFLKQYVSAEQDTASFGTYISISKQL